MLRQALVRNARLFSTSVRTQKSAVDTVKEAAKAVDRTVSGAAIKGIDTGEQVAQAAKEATGMGAGEASGKASEMAGQVTGKASEMTGQASGKTSQMAGEAKGKAHEVAGQVKGKAEEVKQKM